MERRYEFYFLVAKQYIEREVTEIISSINSRVRLSKINQSSPGCSFYEFYE